MSFGVGFVGNFIGCSELPLKIGVGVGVRAEGYGKMS